MGGNRSRQFHFVLPCVVLVGLAFQAFGSPGNPVTPPDASLEDWGEVASPFWLNRIRRASVDDPNPGPSPSPSPSPSPDPGPPPDSRSRLRREIDRSALRLAEAVFDGIDDIQIYKTKGDHFSVDLNVHRRVFDNKDILNSWTVVDRFEIDGAFPIFSDVLSGISTSTSTVSLSLGTNIGLEFVDIRQVLPHRYYELPTAEDRRKEIANSDEMAQANQARIDQKKQNEEIARTQQAGEPDEEEDEVEEPTPPGGHWWTDWKDRFRKRISKYLPTKDPENQARYSRFWNLLLVPMKIPLTADAVSRLEDAEIISYIATGTLQFGPSVGWNLDPTNITGLAEAGVTYSTFLQGSYRTSIMRIDERYVRVKVTRTAGLGHGFTAGINQRSSVLDGVVLLKNLQGNLKVAPFSLALSQSWNHAFDVGYEYDLKNPLARKAYELAVKGRLSYSDELSVYPDGREIPVTEGNGVKKIFSRSAQSYIRAESQSTRIAFLFRKSHNRSLTEVDAEITFPDGKHQIFTSVADSSRSWAFFLGIAERLNTSFRVYLDQDRYKQDPHAPDAMVLVSEGRIQDTDTFRSEIAKYIDKTEDAVGKHGIFPTPPTPADFMRRSHRPIFHAADDSLFGNLGRTTFTHRVGVNLLQIRALLEVPDEKRWAYLESAFEMEPGRWSTRRSRLRYQLPRLPVALLDLILYPLDINIKSGSRLFHARKIYKRWKKAAEARSGREMAERLGELFFDRHYQYELSRLLRSVLNGQPVDYFVSGQAGYFGRIVDQGTTNIRYENVATRADREVGFDFQGPRLADSSTETLVVGLRARMATMKQLNIAFTLNRDPAQMYFQIVRYNWWNPFKNQVIGEVPLGNQDERFKRGSNLLEISLEDKTGPFYPLVHAMEPGDNYYLRVASTLNGQNWGMTSETKFIFPKPPEPEDDD